MCKMAMRSCILLVAAFGVNMQAWALWTCTTGGTKWSFTYTGEGGAIVNGIAENTTSSLVVPSVVSHDNSDNPSAWPVVRLDLKSTISSIREPVASVLIPASVSEVAGSSFDKWFFLQRAEWQTDKPATIGAFMFSSCSNLVSVTMPTNIVSMGIGVFKNCVRLPTVELATTLGEISDSTFMNCASLSYLAIPENVVSIGDSAFRGCSSLSSIKIPARVATIGEYAFYGCASLQYVVIPERVSSLGGYSFAGCTGLKKAFVPVSLKGNLGKVRGKETAFDDVSIVVYYDCDVSQVIVTSDGEPVAVDKTWLEGNASLFLAAAGGDYETAAESVAANGMRVWECYVAGLDTTDPDSRFKVAMEMKEGLPVLTWRPNLNEEIESRIYTIYGKQTLNGEDWTTPTNSLHRFFKVSVALP